jgi:ClpP class serine protease
MLSSGIISELKKIHDGFEATADGLFIKFKDAIVSLDHFRVEEIERFHLLDPARQAHLLDEVVKRAGADVAEVVETVVEKTEEVFTGLKGVASEVVDEVVAKTKKVAKTAEAVVTTVIADEVKTVQDVIKIVDDSKDVDPSELK